MTVFEVFDDASATWVDITNTVGGGWQITHGVSDLQLAPEAEVPTQRDTLSAGQRLRISTDSGTRMFEGQIQRAPVRAARGGGGSVTAEAQHDAFRLFEDTVSVSIDVSTSDQDILSNALADAENGGDYTLNFLNSANQITEYEVADRPLKQVFRDVMARTGQVWYVGVDKTIHVGSYGARGQFAAVDTASDPAIVESYNPDDVDTVVNRVRVNGTAGENVVGTAEDTTSISEYGVQQRTINLKYITNQTEANDAASAFLVPDPLAEASVQLGSAVGELRLPIVNQTLDVTDAAGTGMNESLVIEKQTIEQGRATVKLGEAAGVNVSRVNESRKSTEDTTEPGTVYNTDRIADDAIENSKLVDLSISETKIQDDAISTPKLQAEAVTANEILANTITAAQIDALDLDTGTLTIGTTNTDGGIEFGIQTGTPLGDIAVGEPSQDQAASLGQSGNAFFEGHFGSLFFTQAEWLIENGPDVLFDFNTNFQPEIYPDTDTSGFLGTSGNAWFEVRAENFVDENGNDITGGSIGDSTDAPFSIDSTSGGIDFEFTETGGGDVEGSAERIDITLSLTETHRADVVTNRGTLNTGYAEYRDADFRFTPARNVYIEFSDNGAETVLEPENVKDCEIGTAVLPFKEMNAGNFITQTPDTDIAVDHTDILGYEWDAPPEYLTRRESRGGDGYERANPRKKGIDLGHAANYLFEITKAQSETIETLQETVADLEARLSDLESGGSA